ncbi:MAG TPA: NfeD family protein [Acidobacteriaceae bacterium]|nr:NfeD family protein [Acidobacteriaceae bacterium]
MTTFYLICFTLGLTLTILSALGAFTHLHFGHVHMHLGHAHAHVHIPGAKGAVSKGGVSPINGFTLAAFLCWFGGCGYLLTRSGDFALLTILLLALITGLAGGAILFWFLVRVLLPHERELTAEETAIVGMYGLVTSPIREGGTGEIQFSQNGSRHSAPARCDADGMLALGTEVVVMRYEQGIAYVRAWDEIAGEASSTSAKSSTSNQ